MQPVQFKIMGVCEWEEWRETCLPNLRQAATLAIPHLRLLPSHPGTAAVVGAAPTVGAFKGQLEKIKAGEFNVVASVNGAHNWLIEQGIIPNIHVVFESDLEDVELALNGPPHKGVTYYICSHCDEKIFRQLEGHRRVLWHAWVPLQEYNQAIEDIFPGEFMVAGQYATFFRTLTILMTLGYSDFDLFGLDSSFEHDSHVKGYRTGNLEEAITLWGVDPRNDKLQQFRTNGSLAFQTYCFLDFCMHQSSIKLRVHGDGLLRYLHQSRYPEQYN